MADGDETLIFVDVDGVLNVGIKTGTSGALFLNDPNIGMARQLSESSDSEAAHERLEKMSSVAARYAGLACTGSREVSEVLVRRLVRILRASRGRCRVVLSSSWRHPKHTARVKALEGELSDCLARPFVFDDRTALMREAEPADRLRAIGYYVRRWSAMGAPGRTIHVLILDDLFMTGMDGWMCGGASVNSVKDAEEYVRQCGRQSCDIRAKLVHCYEEWLTPEARIRVEVATGLTAAAVEEAVAFLAEAGKQQWHYKKRLKPSTTSIVATQQVAFCWAGIVSLLQLACLHV
mmetsp:Transcript_95484/g.275700  ORF Transcript_95484/g.275700 Transcript_95484/m.275700 type:complete len:292 (-) Transcript_95484:110-985(-)